VKVSGHRTGHSRAGLIPCANLEPLHDLDFDHLASDSSIEAFGDVGYER
jgi:hypothetical protein